MGPTRNNGRFAGSRPAVSFLSRVDVNKSASRVFGCTPSGTGGTAIFLSKAKENEGFRELCFRKPMSQNYMDAGFGTHSKEYFSHYARGIV